jgi:hypothetical protein
VESAARRSYDEPWWEPLGIRGGRPATDLPIQSCFCFGTEGNAAARRSLAMVGCSSERSIEHFDRYLEESRPGGAIGARSWEVIPRMREPIPGLPYPGP